MICVKFAKNRQVDFGLQILLVLKTRGLQPHDDPNVQRRSGELLEIHPGMMQRLIRPLEVVNDPVNKFDRQLHLVRGRSVDDSDPEHQADDAAIADVFDRFLGDTAVRHAEDTARSERIRVLRIPTELTIPLISPA